LQINTRHSFLECGAKSGKKASKFAEKMQISTKKLKKIGNSIIQSRIFLAIFDEKIEIGPSFRIWIPKTVQRSALCRSRRELSNEYLLAKIGVDTAENEPLDVWGKIFNIIQSCP
jgi:hypothetical protein